MNKKKKTNPQAEIYDTWQEVNAASNKAWNVLMEAFKERNQRDRFFMVGRSIIIIYQRFFSMGIYAAEEHLNRETAARASGPSDE